MTSPTFVNRQQGAALLISMVMLLVLTALAVTSMRGVTLESRMTANRAHAMQLQNAAEAALREAEFRSYLPGSIRDKLEPNKANCTLANTIKKNAPHKACLLDLGIEDQKTFIANPVGFLEGHNPGAGVLSWMPYRGTSFDDITTTTAAYQAYWNSMVAIAVYDDPMEDEENQSAGLDDMIFVENVEYGALAEGRGTYYYLHSGQADDTLVVQSTTAAVFIGLNN